MSLVDTGGKDLLPERGWESWRVHRAFRRWNLVVGCWLHVLEGNCSMLLSSYSFASDYKVNGWLCATTASAVIFHHIPKAKRLSAQALKLLNL